MLSVESPKYSRLDMVVDQFLELRCNTSLTPEIMWTYHNDDSDGYVDYVYWNGSYNNDQRWRRLFIKQIAKDFHVLAIANVERKHSGIYLCYDKTRMRIAGYHVTIAGKKSLYLCSLYILCCNGEHIATSLCRPLITQQSCTTFQSLIIVCLSSCQL